MQQRSYYWSKYRLEEAGFKTIVLKAAKEGCDGERKGMCSREAEGMTTMQFSFEGGDTTTTTKIKNKIYIKNQSSEEERRNLERTYTCTTSAKYKWWFVEETSYFVCNSLSLPLSLCAHARARSAVAYTIYITALPTIYIIALARVCWRHL